ncbi:hypothetical protein [Streptomyces sp. NPDC049906]|uniref:hypothetical protein n=1 Tax=Streptomyces sp. NPDC049906 TaxID=3155656 RepID=UPI00342D2F98
MQQVPLGVGDEPLPALDALVQQHRQHQMLNQQLGARTRPAHLLGEAGTSLLDLGGGDPFRRALKQYLAADLAPQGGDPGGGRDVEVDLLELAVVLDEEDEPDAAEVRDDGVAPAGQQGPGRDRHQVVQGRGEGGQVAVVDADDEVDVREAVGGAGSERAAYRQVGDGRGGRQEAGDAGQQRQLGGPVGLGEFGQVQFGRGQGQCGGHERESFRAGGGADGCGRRHGTRARSLDFAAVQRRLASLSPSAVCRPAIRS